jgi:hypothetical protein
MRAVPVTLAVKANDTEAVVLGWEQAKAGTGL